MNCHEWQTQWQDLLDGVDSGMDRAIWSAHLKDCASCRELHEAGERVLGLLRRQPAPALPDAFASAVLTAVRRDERGQRLRIGTTVGATLAAAVVIWGLVRMVFFPAGAVSPTKLAAPQLAQTLPPSLDAQLAEARSATIDLTRRVARDTARQASLFVPPPPERWAGIGSSTDGRQTASVPVRQMGESVGNSLEPVTASTRRAFDMFRKMLPPTELDKPNS